MACTQYITEIRGDGPTRTWTLEHRLRHPYPTVTLRDANGKDITQDARYEWSNESEVVINIAVPLPVGRI